MMPILVRAPDRAVEAEVLDHAGRRLGADHPWSSKEAFRPGPPFLAGSTRSWWCLLRKLICQAGRTVTFLYTCISSTYEGELLPQGGCEWNWKVSKPSFNIGSGLGKGALLVKVSCFCTCPSVTFISLHSRDKLVRVVALTN